MTQLHQSEGIILHEIPYGNNDQILTIFTSDQGLLKLFCKKGRHKKDKNMRPSPLTKVDVVYREKQSDLYACEEISIIESFLPLRKELSYLQAGCDLIRAVYASQMAGRPAPLLYQLLNYYLEKISLIPDPKVLVASFKLKVLRHEGLLPIDYETIDYFKKDEWDLLHQLTYSKKLSEISVLSLSGQLASTIDTYFLEALQH